ncbi:TlyA family RNA methyltransferase [Sulfurimonas sediminis]|uniref:TlyA family RNA methyltransferase n=1 Tax=Sulfurimonas sediminis TaxID=2590020 RepID=A0A7M1B2C1_9BACT|nr:TlyA family RNA methyltransferase [Sulfurimonas sediminis]QOP43909.1 TlyA family RNA methyltransferase [Sulfurimonas sediminis]
MRLDNYLVKNSLSESRNKAQAMIKNGLVLVNSKTVNKPAFGIEEDDRVEVVQHKIYVSRAALKLAYFLDETGLHVKNKTALDIGSSTGGFTQVLLECGVKTVSCVDVGRDQLHDSLRKDARVSVYEGCDIRRFEADEPFELIVSDVAFISLLYILNDVDRLASGDIILLFKPQFEVGREAKRDKNGVVQDKKAIERAMQKFEDACRLKNWQLVKKSPSKLAGKEGNLEYCYYFKKDRL